MHECLVSTDSAETMNGALRTPREPPLPTPRITRIPQDRAGDHQGLPLERPGSPSPPSPPRIDDPGILLEPREGCR